MDIGDDTDARHVTLGTVMARPRHMSPRHAPKHTSQHRLSVSQPSRYFNGIFQWIFEI